MSHHIYQTKAFVIDSADTGEANKLLSLFTADLGFIIAAAQGVRLVQSKLRQSIQDLSFSKVSLVRGKEVWRLTNAEKLISLYDKRIPIKVRRMLAGIFAFVKRLIQGESKHEELFNFLSKFCDFCLKNKDFSLSHIEALKSFAEMRILHELGYGSDEEIFKRISPSLPPSSSLAQPASAASSTSPALPASSDSQDSPAWNEETILYVESNIDAVRKHIAMALRDSHL